MKFDKHVAALVLLYCGLAAGCHPSRQQQLPEPGTDLYAVAPESIVEVLFSSGTRKLYAYRWDANARFQLVVATKSDSKAANCTAGEGFKRWLSAITRMPIIRESGTRFDPAAPEWADLQLKDSSRIEPIQLRIRIPSASGESVVIASQEHQYLVDIDPSALKLVNAGCAQLGFNQSENKD